VKFALLLVSFGLALSAQTATTTPAPEVSYGLQKGSVGGTLSLGAAHMTGLQGLHAGGQGTVDIGLHKYVGVFMQAGWTPIRSDGSACSYGYCATARGSANLYDLGAGVEVVGSNRSRFVPYGRLGVAYTHGSESASITAGGYGYGGYYSYSYSTSAPAIVTGGGLKTYITHRLSLDTQLSLLRTVGQNGGGWVIAPTVGVSFQSK